MKGEGVFTVDGTDITYEYRCMWGDALMYKVRFQEAPHQWGGWHAFADAESREEFVSEYIGQWLDSQWWKE